MVVKIVLRVYFVVISSDKLLLEDVINDPVKFSSSFQDNRDSLFLFTIISPLYQEGVN